MPKKKPAKKANSKQFVAKSVKRNLQTIVDAICSSRMKGSATSFSATKTEIPDPMGMGMNTYKVQATLVLDYNPTAETVDDMEPPYATVMPSNERLDLNTTDNLTYTGELDGIVTEPVSVIATFRFRSVSMTEEVDF